MRKGWEYKKLGDCTQILDSQRKPVTKRDRKSGIYPYYGATGIQDYVDKYIFDGRYVLVGEDGAKWSSFTQSAFIIEGKTWVNNHAHVLRTNDFLVDSFLVYFLNYSDLDSYISGAIIRKLTQASLRNIDIPLPPKSTQLAIVSELDKINELIRLKKEQLKDFDNLAQSLFYEMFGDPVENEKGWEVKKLGEISSLICNGNTPKGGSEVYVDNGILFLRSQNVWKNRLDLDDVAFIDEATHKTLKKSALNHHDLLITKTGRVNTENSSLGRTALFEGEDGSANINGHVYLVRLKEGMVHKYVLYILISNSYRELIRRTCVGGIDKRQLNKNHIEDFPIILPPLPLQRLFAQRIEQIEREKSEVQKSIQDLETLLASRMQYWFE